MSDKYPRTLHFPYSPGASSDDKIASEEDVELLLNIEAIFTEKLDGSNVCLTRDACYSRSHSGPPTHPSFNQLKVFHQQTKNDIDFGVSLFCEYTMAIHSIVYTALPHYLFLIGVRNDVSGEWLSFDDVEMWAQFLNIPTVPVIFKTIISNREKLKNLVESFAGLSSIYGPDREGLVARRSDQIHVNEYNCLQGVLKMVRANHVQSDVHWMKQSFKKQNILLF